MRLTVIPLFVTSIIFFSSCSWISEQLNQEPKKQPALSPAKKKISSSTPLAEGIEVVWQVPGEKVDGFVVRFGYSKDSLTNDVKIPVSSLSVAQDPEFGPTYRYVVKDIEANRPIFVTLAAFRGEGLSEFSEIFEAGPLPAKK